MCAETKRPSCENLKTRHLEAIKQGESWLEIWSLFHRDAWFQKALMYSANRVVKVFQIDPNQLDDIVQEAQFLMGKHIRQDPGLGYDSRKGSYQAYLSTIIDRCCLKAVRQFRNQLREVTLVKEKATKYLVVDNDNQDRLLDLLNLIDRLPSSERTAIHLHLNGKSIDEIAKTLKRSKRTAYRFLNQAIHDLKQMAAPE